MDTPSENPFSFELLVDVHTAAQDVHEYLAFSSELEALLQRRNLELEAKIEAKLAAIPERKHNELIESYAWDLNQFQSSFPSMHRESMFITLYNYLEYRLNTVCEGIGREMISRVRLKHLSGRGVERAFLFIHVVPEFDLSAISAEVDFIRKANKLRNVVVHNGGLLPEGGREVVNGFVKAESALFGQPGRRVCFGAEFVPLFAVKVQALFDGIGSEMQRFMKHRT